MFTGNIGAHSINIRPLVSKKSRFQNLDPYQDRQNQPQRFTRTCHENLKSRLSFSTVESMLLYGGEAGKIV